MDIEELVKKHCKRWTDTGSMRVSDTIRAALTEADAVLAMEHNFKMLQVESTVRNMEERIRQLEAELAESRERIRQLEADLAESREQAERMLDAIDKLQPLARRVLWMAFVWNDHNFTHPLDYAREEAKKAGLNSLEDAQEFLADVVMLAAAPAKEGYDVSSSN